MYSKEDILVRVRGHLERIAGTDEGIHAETNIAEQFALDSVKLLDLLMDIEDDFDISIPLNLMADVQSVNDLAEAIYKVQSEK